MTVLAACGCTNEGYSLGKNLNSFVDDETQDSLPVSISLALFDLLEMSQL